MKIKLQLLLKYFLCVDGGFFRKSYLFQILSIYFGTLIITLTFSIIDGMEHQIYNKIKSFNYDYIYNVKSTEMDSYQDYNNYGISTLVKCKTLDKQEFTLNLISYHNFNEFINEKISEHLMFGNNDVNNNNVIIGKTLSYNYNILIGDTINIGDILNINSITGYYKTKDFVVSDIYDFKFLNYDNDHIFIKYDNVFFTRNNVDLFYNNHVKYENIPMETTLNQYNTILSSIKFEKYIYISLGILTILISCIMIFNNTVLVLIEKRKQLNLLVNLGLSIHKIKFFNFVNNFMLSIFFSILSIITVYLIILLNTHFKVIDMIFMYSPFTTIPMTISFDKVCFILCLVSVLTLLSTMFSIYVVKTKYIER